MYEELFITDSYRNTKIKKVFSADEGWIEWSVLEGKLEYLFKLMSLADRQRLRSTLLNLAKIGATLAPTSKTVPARRARGISEYNEIEREQHAKAQIS